MNLTGFLNYEQFKAIILIWPINYDQSSIEYCISRAEKKLELYVHPELIGAAPDISLQEFAEKYPINLQNLRNAIAFLAEWYVKAGIYANFLNVSTTAGGNSYNQNFSGGENFIPPAVIEQLVMSKLYQRTNVLDVSASNFETVSDFPGAESTVIPQKLLLWDEELVSENGLALINTDYVFVIFEETKNNLTYWLIQIFAKIQNLTAAGELNWNFILNKPPIPTLPENLAAKVQNLTAEGELSWNFILDKPQIPTFPWLNFLQENATEQNLWTFLNSKNAKIGDIVNVNGRFYTIFLFDSRPSGSYYLWNAQRHFENSQFETETTFLTCANEGNLLNPQILKNVVHQENVLVHDPYGAQAAHNDLPLNRFLRYWDGTVDDLANPNLWQTIFGWPAENENDYSGIYQVFTKNSWKLDRNRLNRIFYNYDESTKADEITFKLPIQTTKSVNFADTELIPQSEVKKLVSAGGGGQPWNGISWINQNDFLELKMGTTAIAPALGQLTDQGRFGVKNQRIKYGSSLDPSFTISGTIYVKNPNIKLPDNNYIFISTTPFSFNLTDNPKFQAVAITWDHNITLYEDTISTPEKTLHTLVEQVSREKVSYYNIRDFERTYKYIFITTEDI